MKTVINWGWCPTLITLLAVLGFVFEWPIEAVAPALILILCIGLVVAFIRVKRQELEFSSLRLRQFYKMAGNVEVPREAIDQYNRFVMEYNAFTQDFRDKISELRKVTKTGIDPPSVKFAKELLR